MLATPTPIAAKVGTPGVPKAEATRHSGAASRCTREAAACCVPARSA
eukprot:CAMPEP_0195117150 /NCGR_PEP_ID=MMETSP0448-20130528/113740_1 /TAXON_ID=66468 /ORGANISM="Heterocapsa triquestra, Strain CCMP 448" /LENGTH=46 /DNA_ID= /DNA_START= /DNA_END= /DNA_ORIENTATION=